jgi:prepilin-type N-terminal cleavage/methylation domain-containing protein
MSSICAAPARPVSRARAFTLIELVLAMSLGAIVVASTVAVFAMLERSSKAQSQRLERAQELTVAQKTMARAFSTLLMTDAQLPNDEELKRRIEQDMAAAGEDRAGIPEPGIARFSLQPSPGVTFPDGRPGQVFSLTLRTPPIIGGLREAGDEESGLTADQAEVLRRQFEAGGIPQGQGQRRPRVSDGPSSRLLLGLVNSGAQDAMSERLLSETARLDDQGELSDPTPNGLLPAKAPGVRGRFEIRPARPDPNDPASAVAGFGNSQQTLELWWVQFPPGVNPEQFGDGPLSRISDEDAEPAPDADTGEPASDAGSIAERLANARQARAKAREIRLISGLSSATWRVYRQKTFITKAKAEFDRELPAYVEFAFTTDDGRAERWAFEVAWAQGPEPGTELRNQTPMGADGLGLVSSAGPRPVLGPDGQPLTGPDGQPITVTIGPDGRPTVSGAGVTAGGETVQIVGGAGGGNGQVQVSVGGRPGTLGPPAQPQVVGGSQSDAEKTGAGGAGGQFGNIGSLGPGGLSRDEVMRLVNERLRQMREGR